MIPPIAALGVGCRKGTPSKAFAEFLDRLMERHRLAPQAVAQVASIRLKKEEPCILDFCRQRRLPFVVFSPEELMALPGQFTPSPFVLKTTGADNVCERSAMAACSRIAKEKSAGLGRLLIPKQTESGMTAAVAVSDWRCKF